MTKSHHTPANLPYSLLIARNNGLQFLLKFRADDFIGIEEEYVVTSGVLKQTISLYGKALPVWVNKSLCSTMTCDFHSAIGTAAIYNY